MSKAEVFDFASSLLCPVAPGTSTTYRIWVWLTAESSLTKVYSTWTWGTDVTSSSIWTFPAAPRFASQSQSSLPSSGRGPPPESQLPAALMAVLCTLMLCIAHSTVCWGFKLHGHSCFALLQDCCYRRLASVHRRVTPTNRQSSLDDETDYFWAQLEGRVQISKTL